MIWLIVLIFFTITLFAAIVILLVKILDLDREIRYKREHQERLRKYMEQHKGDIE